MVEEYVFVYDTERKKTETRATNTLNLSEKNLILQVFCFVLFTLQVFCFVFFFLFSLQQSTQTSDQICGGVGSPK